MPIPSRMERTMQIFAKYQVDIDDGDIELFQDSEPPRERVTKTIRMRVRYTCHKCQTTFGKNFSCGSCQHRRCKLCTRYPPKRAVPRSATADDIKPPASSLNDRKASFVSKSPVCHECQTDISPGQDECINCQHKLCDRCIPEIVAKSKTIEAEPTTQTNSSHNSDAVTITDGVQPTEVEASAITNAEPKTLDSKGSSSIIDSSSTMPTGSSSVSS